MVFSLKYYISLYFISAKCECVQTHTYTFTAKVNQSHIKTKPKPKTNTNTKKKFIDNHILCVRKYNKIQINRDIA